MRTSAKVGIVIAGLTAGSVLGAPASHASGDAPWCAITEVGDGDGQWDCAYDTVDECVPHVLAGNRGHCSPNPYAVNPAPVSAPTAGPTSTTPATAGNRKSQKDAK